jgi:hypothetical protein
MSNYLTSNFPYRVNDNSYPQFQKFPQYLDGGQNSIARSFNVPAYTVNVEKQCSYDCKKCEQCHVVGLEGEKKYWNCNQECARCIQCKTFATPPLSYHTPIPRDQYTLTHQPEFHPNPSEDHRKPCNERCNGCNNFYLDDHRKHMCFECERKMVNKVNKPLAHNYQDTFFYKFIKEY